MTRRRGLFWRLRGEFLAAPATFRKQSTLAGKFSAAGKSKQRRTNGLLKGWAGTRRRRSNMGTRERRGCKI